MYKIENVVFDELDSQLLKDIRKLASGNMAPSDIALKLGVNKSGFMRIWRENGSAIREAYEGGRLDIAAIKAKQLKKEIKSGNITAIQIHDKLAEEADFEAQKKQIFGLD